MLSRRPLVRTDAADMLKRPLKGAKLPAHCSPHSFRATGITNFLEGDGTLGLFFGDAEAVHNFIAHIDRCAMMLRRARVRNATRLGESHPYKPIIEHFSFQYRNLEGTYSAKMSSRQMRKYGLTQIRTTDGTKQ
jgi:hypothetical protein